MIRLIDQLGIIPRPQKADDERPSMIYDQAIRLVENIDILLGDCAKYHPTAIVEAFGICLLQAVALRDDPDGKEHIEVTVRVGDMQVHQDDLDPKRDAVVRGAIEKMRGAKE